MRIFVTGAAARLARSLLPRLLADPRISRVTGIDLVAPAIRHPRLDFRRLDIRDPAVTALMPGHEALIHLAFVVLRGRMPAAAMDAINVDGSLRVFRGARSAGIPRLVHVSSAAVYGSGERLAEDAPLDPLPGFLYARHKAELEARLAGDFPDGLRFRPHIILGPHAQPVLRQLLLQPFYLRLPDPQPLLQCVHEEDVAAAILVALGCRSAGPFNLAAEDGFSFAEIIGRLHPVRAALPMGLARVTLGALWKSFGWGGETAWLKGLSRTLTLDCSRARSELGWAPRYTAWEAIEQTLRGA
ncbi:MAG: NAD-dependent epimerase/dehydratase family protein [Betaproteobacteria bacterium]|nr:NAD-dependent epimerase/dehydratase family protein [Betaproteobacteria bacterium]